MRYEVLPCILQEIIIDVIPCFLLAVEGGGGEETETKKDGQCGKISS